MLDAESLAERVRQKLSRMPEFSLYQAFMAVDKDRNGFITIDEFQRILNSHNIFASSKDLQSLMGKYDKNRDGRVSYTDFVQEITPKSPRRF
jgi:Ca2+-binding EF-hand superfamily protein